MLGRAGWLTLGQLHAALRRAVILADPQGAERRREQAERNAKVACYPEDEGTATLAGYSLPGVEASAAMARITALAKAMKAAGDSGQLDLVRARVFLGLLLGTLPYIPPAPGAPPDVPPPGPGVPPAAPTSPTDVPSADEPGKGPAHWPALPPSNAPAPAALGGVRPLAGSRGLLSLTGPFGTLAGTGTMPAQLSRLGVITAGQARQLACVAALNPATKWRVVVTAGSGEAIAVAPVPRSRGLGRGGSDPRGDDTHGPGLVSQVTVIVNADTPNGQSWPDMAARASPLGTSAGASPVAGSALAKILGLAATAAAREAGLAAERRRADARAGGCAHDLASAAYRPPPRVAELVIARDGTCRFRTCRRPAEQCDLDHVTPFGQGGPTCTCNLGGQCRSHHQLKQHPRWTLTEPAPGVFLWTTPAGRSYTVRPDPLAA